MTPREIIDWTLQKSGWGTLAELEEKKWIDCQPEFDKAHYIERLRLSRQEVPLQARLAEHAGAARQRHPHRSTTCRACPIIGT